MTTTAISITTDLPERPAPFDPAKINDLSIVSQDTYELACEGLREIKAVRRQIEADRKQLKEGVLQAGRAIDDKARKADAPWKAAEDSLAPRITAYVEEQRRIEREEQRRLEAEARKAAEEEQLAAAEAAQKAGASEVEVEAILTEEPVQAPMPVATPRVQRVAGVSTTTTYGAEFIDAAALCRHVIATRQYHLIEPNVPALNKLATAMKDSFRVPGCRLVKKTGVRTRL
jgi:hypothetical protein